MTFTDAELIQKYVSLRDRRKEIETRQKEELLPIMAGMETIEAVLHQLLDSRGAESIKTEYGTAYKVTNMAAKTADRHALMTYVADHSAYNLLTAAVSKEAVKEYMQSSGGHPPPGVDVTFITSVNFRRA